MRAIGGVGHFIARPHGAVNPVLGAEQGHQLHPRGGAEQVNGGIQLAIHARRIGQQPDALSLQNLEALRGEDLVPKFDFGPGGPA